VVPGLLFLVSCQIQNEGFMTVEIEQYAQQPKNYFSNYVYAVKPIFQYFKDKNDAT
jgi:hypothetical protein